VAAVTLPWAFAAAVVALEVPYPLVSGRARDVLTIATVVTFALASATHALLTRGARTAAALVALAAGGGFLAEEIGTHTGVPFGRYTYDGSLGPRLGGVPLVIPLAWVMMAWPALLVARRIGRAVPFVAGWALASWDVFLDPQMVAAGHWRWHDVAAHLPGIPSVPVTNYLGWLAVATVLMAVLHRVVPRAAANDAPPLALYGWTFASSVLANLAFFHRPAVALWGGLAMGAVVLAWAAS
jgi:putative membrane protein